MQLLHVVSFGLSLHAVASGDKRCIPLRVGIWELIFHPSRSARRYYLDHGALVKENSLEEVLL